MKLIDTHCHLDEIIDTDTAVREAKEAGVTAIVAVGIDLITNEKVLELAGRYPGFVYPAMGLHPQELPVMNDIAVARCLKQIEDHIGEIVGIGEVGLDYHKRIRAEAPKDRQQEILKDVMKLAVRYDKPVLLHTRYAWRDSLNLAIETGVKDAVFHWYTGPSSVLRDLIEQGYYISATPATEYHSEHRRAIREAPLERLFLETDAPVHYGREEGFEAAPKDVVRSLNASAEIRGEDPVSLGEQTTINALRFFRL